MNQSPTQPNLTLCLFYGKLKSRMQSKYILRIVITALFSTVLCHTFQLQFLQNPPTDIAKTYQNQFVTLTDGGPT